MCINKGGLAEGFDKLGFKLLSNWDELEIMNKGLLFPKSRGSILEIFVSFRDGLRGVRSLAEKRGRCQGRSFSRLMGGLLVGFLSKEIHHGDRLKEEIKLA